MDQTSSGLDQVCIGLVRKRALNIVKQDQNFELEWVFAEYGAGQAVSEIAKELGKSEGYVYARMRQKPDKYEDVKRIREENHNVRIRRIRGLADKRILEYLEGLFGDDKEAGEDIDRVNRIAKDYAHRVQLAEGRARGTARNGILRESLGARVR